MTLRQLMERLTYVAAQVGVDLPVVIAMPCDDGKLLGFTDLDVAVSRDAPDALAHQVVIFQPPRLLANMEMEGEA